MNKLLISKGYQEVQDFICKQIETLDGQAQFKEDQWERQDGGGGKTRIIADGQLIEKGGVNFSEVHGQLTPQMQQQLNIAGDTFFACGVSIVIHPKSPHVPIIHMNVRYFETNNGAEYWFGGGIDLTPHIIVDDLANTFHKDLQTICNQFDPSFYNTFKANADEYFFIPHRNETRGIGGIFYDHLHEDNTKLTKTDIFNFSQKIGMQFPEIYKSQTVNRNQKITPAEKNWQLLRRGRYVEFNLVYDRGTKFGLFSNGRTESILMSLPLDARWMYNYEAQENFEINTLQKLKKGIYWI